MEGRARHGVKGVGEGCDRLLRRRDDDDGGEEVDRGGPVREKEECDERRRRRVHEKRLDQNRPIHRAEVRRRRC